MAIEIERKYLVNDDAWQPLVTQRVRILQGYFARTALMRARIRLIDNDQAFISEARKLKPPVFRCRLHMPREVWIRIDHIRRRHGRVLALSENRCLRGAGLAMLRQIEIREVLHRWEIDPEFEADMIALSPGDQKRVDEWLTERGFDLDHLPETGGSMTPCRRGFVNLRVALHLSGRLTASLAMRSVRSAIRRDASWFAAKEALEATLPAWDSDPDSTEWQVIP